MVKKPVVAVQELFSIVQQPKTLGILKHLIKF